MAMTTRARMALFLSIAALLVAGIAGAQYVGAGSPNRGRRIRTWIRRRRGRGRRDLRRAGPPADGARATLARGGVQRHDRRSGRELDPGDCGEKVSGTGPGRDRQLHAVSR